MVAPHCSGCLRDADTLAARRLGMEEWFRQSIGATLATPGGLKGRDIVAQGDALGKAVNWRR